MSSYDIFRVLYLILCPPSLSVCDPPSQSLPSLSITSPQQHDKWTENRVTVGDVSALYPPITNNRRNLYHTMYCNEKASVRKPGYLSTGHTQILYWSHTSWNKINTEITPLFVILLVNQALTHQWYFVKCSDHPQTVQWGDVWGWGSYNGVLYWESNVELSQDNIVAQCVDCYFFTL